MRAVAVSVWIFINLVFVGMCGYIYLLWSQYWRYVERQNGQLGNVFNPSRSYGYSAYSSSGGSAAAAAGASASGQIYYYYHGSSAEAAAAAAAAAAAGPSGERAGGGGGGGGRARRDNRTLPKHHLRERPARGWATGAGAGAGAAARRRSASQPRFPQLQPPQPHSQADGWAPRCDAGDSAECGGAGRASPQPPLDEKLVAKVASYKAQLVVQLRRVLLDEGSVFRAGGRGAAANPYHVNYAGPRGSYAGRTARELVCELHQAAAGVRTLRPHDQPFRRLGLGARFPATPLLPPAPAPATGPATGPAPAPAPRATPPRRQRACAVVSNAGALAGSGLGAFIDKHDLVLRFNHAPTINYEHDVGTKTTIRIVNSQVVSKPEFDFLNSPLYEDVALLVWDPSNYSATLEEWYANPDFDLFTPYFVHRELHPERNFHVLEPRSLWALWEFIQSHIPVRIRKNPPSSGFLGLALLLPHCAYVDLFEYVPSMRLTKRCHYWEAAEDLSCTFGVWHPLAAEKLLALALNVANDQTVYTTGYIRVLGYDTLRC